MANLLDLNEILYSQVSLKSAYIDIPSVAITFQVDLVGGNQTYNFSRFSSFVEDSESFSNFSGYSVMEGGRGVLDITVAGKTFSYPCALCLVYMQTHASCVLSVTRYLPVLIGWHG